MLHKSIANSLKDVDTKQGIVCAYASSFGVLDDGGDICVKGCYSKTIAEQGPQARQPRIKFLYQHDAVGGLIGVPHVLREDDFGLYFEAKVLPTALGSDVLTLYQSGCITEHSIGYEVVDSVWDHNKGARLLKQLRLFEVSAVTWGMNPETPTVGVKSLADPSRLTEMAKQARQLDSILHSGDLRSDALCADLERQLKALQTALAPSPVAASQPYSIQGVLDSMNDLVDRLAGKAGADDDAHKAQEARSKKCGIGIKDGGHLTCPSKYESIADDMASWGDWTNYSYPLDTKAHADNAASRFGDPDNRAVYTKSEQGIIDKRIAAAQKKFGESDDSGKAAHMDTILVKGSGGDIAVAADGTHAAYTGSHTHTHPTYGSQGGDDTHKHSHDHDDDSSHDHSHVGPKAHSHPHPHKTPPVDRPVRKARDFGTLFASLNASDQLQDDWGDTFIAFVQCMEELMWQASAQANGWTPNDSASVDIGDAAQSNLNAFTDAVMDLVNRSVAADFVPQMTCDRDQFIDPDGPNAESDDEYGHGYMGRNPVAEPKRMPNAPALLGKEGRSISNANRAYITSALDGMAIHMKGMQEHHASLVDLMNKTDPDHVRQDEDNVLGDSDEENGGTNINKGRQTSYTPRRTAAGSPPQAGTTHQGIDVSAALADLDALKSRLIRAGGKA